MSFSSIARPPARMSITNVNTVESLEAQFNPTELEEQLATNWTRQTVPGLSHQPLQFNYVENYKLTLELFIDGHGSAAQLDQLLRARRFLMSLCYPRRGAQDVASGAPPRALFVWPRVISLTTVVTSFSCKWTQFNVEGTPVQLTAKVALEEIRDVRLVSEDVLASGTLRSGARGGSS